MDRTDDDHFVWGFVAEQPQWADHGRLGPPGSETPELALSTEVKQAVLRWSLAKRETGLLTVAHPEWVAGLLDHIKRLEVVAIQWHRPRRPEE
jgi:hypothetical protein